MNEDLPGIFIHSDLDDAGLKPSEFRVICHIARRGNCFASIDSMSHYCKLSKATTRKALKSLVAQSFITAETRDGRTTLYEIAPIDDWNPFDPTTPLTKQSMGVNHKDPPHKTGEGHPYQNVVGKVYPIEVTPIEVNPLKERTINLQNLSLQELGTVYRKYFWRGKAEGESDNPDEAIMDEMNECVKIIEAEYLRRGEKI